MHIDDFIALKWSEPGVPLIEPPRLSPIIADPSFLFPEETPNGEWELAAHSAWGLCRYTSDDGLSWQGKGLVIKNAMRPFLRPYGDGFLLYYEKYRPLALPMSALPFRPRWQSVISISKSADLRHWSPARTILSPDLTWMRDSRLGNSVSNPCVVAENSVARAGDSWRLYFSASLSWIDDCGFCEPRYLAVAIGGSPEGPFIPEAHPLAYPVDGGGSPHDLGAGAMKIIPMDDGWIGLQNRIFRDAGGRSRSAIFVLRSEDGLRWIKARDEALLAPAPGWTSSHVYACDCRFREADGSWYLYFNARDGWRIRDGRERIGRIVGKPRGA